ncbi:unnamed protein product [Mesocestoides corti]|uniref:MARVEL domain-containing protein n=1 Tax=Mesocestoides corti TaxID=53468 RepID=A0A0R3UAS8_MESCO|nr:unnamed protein product [Mesocestoides corti]
MTVFKVVNLVEVAASVTLLVIVMVVGAENCWNAGQCANPLFLAQSVLLFVAAIFLAVTTIIYLVSFYKHGFCLRVAYVLTGIVGVLCSLAGTAVMPYALGHQWTHWLATIAMTIALSFTINVIFAFPQKKS